MSCLCKKPTSSLKNPGRPVALEVITAKKILWLFTYRIRRCSSTEVKLVTVWGAEMLFSPEDWPDLKDLGAHDMLERVTKSISGESPLTITGSRSMSFYSTEKRSLTIADGSGSARSHSLRSSAFVNYKDDIDWKGNSKGWLKSYRVLCFHEELYKVGSCSSTS